MSVLNQPLKTQLLGLDNCPHCGIASPFLKRVWVSDYPTPRTDGGSKRHWASFLCSVCGGVTTAKCSVAAPNVVSNIAEIFPNEWQADLSIPERARNYIEQAKRTIGAPDASVMMSASSIDAMLKDKGFDKGSLYERINQAVKDGIITQGMSEWAHRVRLDANNPRHADANDPHMLQEDAERAFEYAKTLAEILYMLPNKMPPKKEE